MSALDFTGFALHTDEINHGSITGIRNDALSFYGWFWFDALTNNTNLAGDRSGATRSFRLGVNTNGFFFVRYRGTTNSEATPSIGWYPAGEWVFLAIVDPGAGVDSGPRFYKGNQTTPVVEETSYVSQNFGSGTVNAGDDFGLMNGGGARAAGMPGKVAYTGIATRALSVGELNALRLNPWRGSKTETILRTFPGWQGQSTAFDMSGNANHGTIAGSTALFRSPGLIQRFPDIGLTRTQKPVVAGITGSGAITSPVPTLAGTAEITKTGSGAISTPIITLSGTAEITKTASGAIATPVPTLDGTGQVGTAVTGSGAIATPIATLSGTGLVGTAVTGSGAISTPVPLLEGVEVPAPDSTGDIVSIPDRGERLVDEQGQALPRLQTYLDDITLAINEGRTILRTYTVATLPNAGTAYGLIMVLDETGGAVPAFSDLTNWRRVTDRVVIS